MKLYRRKFLGHIFAVLIHAHANNVAFHDVGQHGIGPGKNQLTQRNQSLKPSERRVQNIDVVNRLTVRRLLAKLLQGVSSTVIFAGK